MNSCRGKSARPCSANLSQIHLMRTLILGAGFSGARIAQKAGAYGVVSGTRREPTGVDELIAQGIQGFVLNGELSDALVSELALTTHLVVSVAPDRQAPFHDPMLSLLSQLPIHSMPKLAWIGYLSTIGVYGNHDGTWVDESTVCRSSQSRSLMRGEAEIAWQHFGRQHNVPVSVLRLSGIYGPGRNAVLDALNGRARMLIKPHQVFNRIHVDDLASATVSAAQLLHDGVLNITDDVPAPPQDVVRYAHALIGKPPPIAQAFATADISPMARSFYSENKRVLNVASKRILKFSYRFPNYRVALSDLWKLHNERL